MHHESWRRVSVFRLIKSNINFFDKFEKKTPWQQGFLRSLSMPTKNGGLPPVRRPKADLILRNLQRSFNGSSTKEGRCDLL